MAGSVTQKYRADSNALCVVYVSELGKGIV
jgi:hypothetical protein